MANNYETVTVLTEIPNDLIRPVHKVLLEGLGFEIYKDDKGTSYIYAEDAGNNFEGMDPDEYAAEVIFHPLFVAAMKDGDSIDLSDVLADMLRGADPAILPHIDVMAGYRCDKPRPGEHGGWSMRVTRDHIKHQSTHGLFNEWDTENQRITDLERMCLALNGHHDPDVAAAVARISDYITNHPALADEDDAPQIAPPSLEKAVKALHQANCEVNGHGFEVMTALVASTAHVTAEENDMLCLQQDCPGENLSVAMEGDYGWTFYIGDGVSDYARGLSEGFAGAINYARSQGFDWLRLDSDAPSLPGVTTYVW